MVRRAGWRADLFLASLTAATLLASAGCGNGGTPSGSTSPAARSTAGSSTGGGGGGGGGSTGTGGLTVSAGPKLVDPQGASTSRVLHTATTLNDGRVMILGGLTPTGATPSADFDVYFYDETANAVTSVLKNVRQASTLQTHVMTAPGQMSLGTQSVPFVICLRYGHTATKLSNGQVVIVGGGGWDTTNAQGQQVQVGAMKSIHVFDPAQGDTFTLAPIKLSTARIFHSAILLAGDKILIMGGQDDSATPKVNASAEILDFSVSPPTVKPAGTGPRGLFYSASGPMGAGAVQWGGSSDNLFPSATKNTFPILPGLAHDGGSSITEIGSLNGQAPNLLDAWSIGPAYCMVGSTLFTAGGLSFAVVQQQAQIGPQHGAYSIQGLQGNFQAIGDLATPRAIASAALVNNADVVVAGGHDASGLAAQTPAPSPSVQTAELWTASTVTFTGSVRMLQPRAGAAAVSLKSGKVLLVGGSDNSTQLFPIDGTPTEQLEIYSK